MKHTDFRIDYLLAYEKFLPVLTPSEVDALLASRPTLDQLQDWSQRLNNHRARLDSVFSRAYIKIK
nr:MAG TPA: hypothetical protein [Caudoviricetes sp.]